MFVPPAIRVGISLCVFLGLAALTGCGGSSQSSNIVKPPKTLTQVTVNPNNPSLAQGASLQLTATAGFSDGSHQDVTALATWNTSQTTVATVSASGDLKAMGPGSADVTAEYQGTMGKAAVTVAAASLVSIAVSPGQFSLPVGDTEQLSATGTFSDGTKADITNSAIWASSGTGVASVTATGHAVANGTGTATISAASGSLTGSALLTVTPAAAVSLSIVPNTAQVALGSSRQLQAVATLSDGSSQDMTGLVSWSSAEASIVNVNAGGLIVGQQVGSTTVQASGNDLTAAANVSVSPLIAVNYFNTASAAQAGADGTVRLTNPGVSDESLCSMIYVFDESQELTECCGCIVTDSGLRTLSLLLDLTSNPVTGTRPRAGVIKVVPSDLSTNPGCDPGTLTPKGVVLGWGSNVQVLSDGSVQGTETRFETAALSDGETTSLINDCNFARHLGSGKGVCSCGSGD